MGLASALAKGINGYTRGLELRDEKERQARDDAWKQEVQDNTRASWKRERDADLALSNAARPAQVDVGSVVTDNAGSNAFTKDADAAAMMVDMGNAKSGGAGLSSATRVNDTAYIDPVAATKAAAAYDNPVSKSERMASALMAMKPVEGLSMANTSMQMREAQNKADDRLIAKAKLAQTEGLGDVLSGMLAKDPQAIADGFNKTGQMKIEGLPTLVETRKFKTPFGEVDDDVWEATVIGADGQKRTIRQSTQQVGMQLYEVKDILQRQDKAAEMGLSHTNKMAQIRAAATGQQKPPAGYEFAPDGGLRPIKGGPADTSSRAPVAPSGYRFTEGGALQPIPGGPADKQQQLKPLPTSAAGGLISNVQNLRRAEDALALLSGKRLQGGAVGDKNATGLKNVLPNQLLNRFDPDGVDTRAAVADLGSLVIHDRSGAAVTAAEFPRLAPFIPTATDDPETARKKLAQFVQNYKATVEDTAEFYRASGYNVPTETLRTTNAEPPSGGGKADGKIPQVSSFTEAMKMPSGTVFIDPNGVKRKVP